MCVCVCAYIYVYVFLRSKVNFNLAGMWVCGHCGDYRLLYFILCSIAFAISQSGKQLILPTVFAVS